MQERKCSICQTVLLKRQKRYCSPSCKYTGVGIQVRGKKPWNKGKTKKEFPQMSNSGVPKGTVPFNAGKKLSEAHREALRKKKPMSLAGKISHRDSYRKGKRRPWNKIGNGITPINELIRHSPEYKEWRKADFERDNYICQNCKQRCSGNLNAHHIKPFSTNKELRFSVDNGKTLCVNCHKQEHKA